MLLPLFSKMEMYVASPVSRRLVFVSVFNMRPYPAASSKLVTTYGTERTAGLLARRHGDSSRPAVLFHGTTPNVPRKFHALVSLSSCPLFNNRTAAVAVAVAMAAEAAATAAEAVRKALDGLTIMYHAGEQLAMNAQYELTVGESTRQSTCRKLH